jgi:hypothetical protein
LLEVADAARFTWQLLRERAASLIRLEMLGGECRLNGRDTSGSTVLVEIAGRFGRAPLSHLKAGDYPSRRTFPARYRGAVIGTFIAYS